MKNIIILLILTTFFAFSCKKDTLETANPDAQYSAMAVSDLFAQWKFKGYTDGKIPQYDVSLEFKTEKSEDGRYSLNGRSSVNFYFANFVADQSKKTMTISTIGSTKIGGDAEASKFEMIYYERLVKVSRYDFKDKNTLLLYLSSPAKEIMYFERKN